MDDWIEYLVDNLSIEIDQFTEFGPIEYLEVTLKLHGNAISRSSCPLPNQSEELL